MKFCLKTLLLVVILFGIDRLIGTAFESMKDVGLEKNPADENYTAYYAIEKVNTDVVVIGSSRAAHHYVPSILEKELKMSVYNCGQDACFFMYQNCVINMMLERYIPKIIIWDIQPGSFIGTLDREFLNVRLLTPYYYENEFAKKYVDCESSRMPYRMVCRMYAYNSKLHNYLLPIFMHTDASKKGYYPLPVKGYKYPKMRIEKDKGEQTINERMMTLFETTIKKCKQNGVKLFVFVSPSFSSETDCVKQVVKELEMIAEQNNTSFGNYMSDETFISNPKLFKDASHMNDNGARIFTDIIAKRILYDFSK